MTDLGALCRACGLCCDGSLFGRAGLDADEVENARRHRLRVVSNGATFEQPCSAYSTGSCSIYEERPRSCRRFVCKLLARLRVDDISLDASVARVARARELLAHLAATGTAPAELGRLLVDDFERA